MEEAAILLREILSSRRRANPRYSLRRLAQETGIEVSTLSRILAGKKGLSNLQLKRLVGSGALRPNEIDRFVRAATGSGSSVVGASSAAKGKASKREIHEVDLSFDFEWVDLAILEWLGLPGRAHSIDTIAAGLSIAPPRVITSIERLEKHGLIRLRGERYSKVKQHLLIGAFPSSMDSLREFHRNAILRGLNEMQKKDAADFERRLINSFIVSTTPERIAEAKERIGTFQDELIRFLTEGKPTVLYGLSTLFYPIT